MFFLLASIVEMIHDFPEADSDLGVSRSGLTGRFLELASGGSEGAELAPCSPDDRMKGQ